MPLVYSADPRNDRFLVKPIIIDRLRPVSP